MTIFVTYRPQSGILYRCRCVAYDGNLVTWRCVKTGEVLYTALDMRDRIKGLQALMRIEHCARVQVTCPNDLIDVEAVLRLANGLLEIVPMPVLDYDKVPSEHAYNKRTELVQCRLTKYERELLDSALTNGEKASDFIRKAIDGEFVTRGLLRPGFDQDLDYDKLPPDQRPVMNPDGTVDWSRVPAEFRLRI